MFLTFSIDKSSILCTITQLFSLLSFVSALILMQMVKNPKISPCPIAGWWPRLNVQHVFTTLYSCQWGGGRQGGKWSLIYRRLAARPALSRRCWRSQGEISQCILGETVVFTICIIEVTKTTNTSLVWKKVTAVMVLLKTAVGLFFQQKCNKLKLSMKIIL